MCGLHGQLLHSKVENVTATGDVLMGMFPLGTSESHNGLGENDLHETIPLAVIVLLAYKLL